MSDNNGGSSEEEAISLPWTRESLQQPDGQAEALITIYESTEANRRGLARHSSSFKKFRDEFDGEKGAIAGALGILGKKVDTTNERINEVLRQVERLTRIVSVEEKEIAKQKVQLEAVRAAKEQQGLKIAAQESRQNEQERKIEELDRETENTGRHLAVVAHVAEVVVKSAAEEKAEARQSKANLEEERNKWLAEEREVLRKLSDERRDSLRVQRREKRKAIYKVVTGLVLLIGAAIAAYIKTH